MDPFIISAVSGRRVNGTLNLIRLAIVIMHMLKRDIIRILHQAQNDSQVIGCHSKHSEESALLAIRPRSYQVAMMIYWDKEDYGSERILEGVYGYIK